MEERNSTYQYLPVSHTGFQDMDSTKSRTSQTQSPHSCRACCTRLRSGKCNVALLIASAFILWVIIHTANSGEQSENAELKELQAEDKSARDWETLKSDKLESEESLNGQYDGVYEDETEDTTQGNNVLEHTEDDSELDHYGSTESSVFRENENADTDFANGSMENMIMKVVEDKTKLYDTEEEIYEDGEDSKMTDNELTQDRFAKYNIEEDRGETEVEINVSDDLNQNDSAVDEHEIIDSESLNANSLDTKSLRFEVENTDPVFDENDSKQEGLALETDTSNKEHISSNDELLNIADSGKVFDKQSYKQDIAVNVDSTGGNNNSKPQLLDNKTSKSFNLTDGTNFFKETINFQEGKSQNSDKKTAEDILHVDSLQFDNAMNQQSLNTDTNLASSNAENTNDSLVPNRINFAESFHKMVDPELDSIKFIQNSTKTGDGIPDLKNGQKLTFINDFKEYNGNTDMISNKNTDEIILSDSKEATDLNPGEMTALHDNYPPKNKDTQRNKRSLVHVLKVPLRPKKK